MCVGACVCMITLLLFATLSIHYIVPLCQVEYMGCAMWIHVRACLCMCVCECASVSVNINVSVSVSVNRCESVSVCLSYSLLNLNVFIGCLICEFSNLFKHVNYIRYIA